MCNNGLWLLDAFRFVRGGVGHAYRWASESVAHDDTPKPTPLPRVLFHEYGMQLRLEADDRLVLNVLCGRIAQYGVEFELNADERRQYGNDGDEFVKRLSLEVQNDPTRFGARGTFC